MKEILIDIQDRSVVEEAENKGTTVIEKYLFFIGFAFPVAWFIGSSSCGKGNKEVCYLAFVWKKRCRIAATASLTLLIVIAAVVMVVNPRLFGLKMEVTGAQTSSATSNAIRPGVPIIGTNDWGDTVAGITVDDNFRNEQLQPTFLGSDTSNLNLQNTGTSTSKRTRITRACDTCRRKKIKCDVDSRHPCTTCSQYDWECTFHDTAKKRGPPKGYIESLETRLEKMEKLLQQIGNNNDGDEVVRDLPLSLSTSSNRQRKKRQASDSLSHAENTTTTMIASSSPSLSEPAASTPTSSSSSSKARDPKRGKVVRYHGSSSGYYLVGNILDNSNSSSTSDSNQHETSTAQDTIESDRLRKVYVVPSFNGGQDIRLRRVNADDDDLMVVRDTTADEEAFQLADDGQEAIDDLIPRSVLTRLVHTYFRDAHTTLPVLEKDEYMDAFEGRTTPPPAPLLTYAICTYSCFLLKANDSIFKEAGVERDHVFQTLLDRATFLVRKEYLKPRIVTIQALVLLCAHPTYSTSSYRNWILAGMAVRMAQDLGLHRTLTTVEVSSDFKEKRKRLWYSCYITDRWCCAVMGRPLAIADSDCDVDLPLIHGSDGNEDLTMFVNFIKLSGILGEVLRRIYSPKAKLNGYKTKAMEQTVWSLQRMLEEWFKNVPSGYKITENDLSDLRHNKDLYAPDSKKIMEGGPLTVCYHAVVLLLHRPFIVLENDQADMPSPLSRATLLCKTAAKLAIDVARAIPYMAIAKFGWNFAAYSVFQAALIHIYNCTSTDPDIAKEAQQYVTICTDECLAPLSKDIPAGPPLIPFLQTLSSLLKPENSNANDGSKFAESSSSPAQQHQPQPYHQQQYPQPQPQPQLEQQPYPPTYPGVSAPAAVGGVLPPMMTNVTGSFVEELNNYGGHSWLLNGSSGAGPALSQAAWQQLFSSAGTPFTENANRGVDVQGWDNFFMENQPNTTFMP
ncbi:hypothetical protein [Parasitella parasitica]|uniref:Zn(2)-C6 fungal-type domain-containing protein n=2 Tax=Mucoraceae TaxID=34489 RepID=A0A0B7MYG2_9FUNG|nr:hypothetical protein [Parasitella parasitica]